jgi:hypothetical protein
MSTPLLATKLYLPPLRANLVPRPRLVERLDEASARDTGWGSYPPRPALARRRC